MPQASGSDQINASTADARHGAQNRLTDTPFKESFHCLFSHRMVKARVDLPRNDEFTSYHKPKTTHTTTHEDHTHTQTTH